MRCPYCHKDNDRVVDSRSVQSADIVRRRRECLSCSKRFTTYEQVEEARLRVIKKDGSRVGFERQKIVDGLLKACYKRPVSTEEIDQLVRQVENQINETYDREVPSLVIGGMVMEQLKKLDTVAYLRFASVYREFKDASDFVQEARPMMRSREAPQGGPAAPEGRAADWLLNENNIG